MYLREPCYDIYELTKSNLHVHTSFSGCAKPEMRMKDILKRADELRLDTIAIVDHYNFSNTPMLEKNMCDRWWIDYMEPNVKVLLGAELSAYGIGKWLDSDELNAALDYRLYAANHYHLDFWEQPEDKSPRGYALHTVAVLTKLILSHRADCIAHPVAGSYANELKDKLALSKAMTDNELGDLLSLARDNSVAWEINEGEALWDADFSRRFWNLGKEIGVVFHFGTDSHTLENMDTLRKKDELIKIFC